MPSNATLIDVDEDGDGGVVAWLDTSDNTKMYVSTQTSGIKVEGNENSYGMFNNNSNLINIDLSNFDTSKVTDMYSMFSNSGVSVIKVGANFKWADTLNRVGLGYSTWKMKKVQDILIQIHSQPVHILILKYLKYKKYMESRFPYSPYYSIFGLAS